MAEKNTENLTNNNAIEETIQHAEEGKEINHTHEQNVPESGQEKSAQEIFEDRWELFMGPLSKAVKENNIPVALAVVNDPEMGVLFYCNGHIYEQCKLAAKLYSSLKSRVDQELSTSPDQ